MSLAIIHSGGTNISSVRYALQRLGADPVFTADPAIIRSAERVILPGVGAAGAAMQQLREKRLVDCIKGLHQPVLGICLGMQLLYESSSEDETQCLGIIPGTLSKLEPGPGIRIPHMGWNSTQQLRSDPLCDGLDNSAWFYFVHSFGAPLGPATLTSCTHGQSFSAMVQQDNFRGAQFHPERSASAGARVLDNFLRIEG